MSQPPQAPSRRAFLRATLCSATGLYAGTLLAFGRPEDAVLPEYLDDLARFERGYNLWSHELRKNETKMVAALNAGRASMTTPTGNSESIKHRDPRDFVLIKSKKVVAKKLV